MINIISKDTTIRIRAETKDLLDSLNIARKNTSYNDIILKLIEEFNSKIAK